MTVWRLASGRYDPLDGEGARRAGGRWNPAGHAAVYASGSLALAVLEVLVHSPRYRLPGDFMAFEIEIPSGHVPEVLGRLPIGWDDVAPSRECLEAGEDWLVSKRSLVLAVPSVVVPLESNYLINPLHPAMKRVRVVRREPFRFDPRFAAPPAS